MSTRGGKVKKKSKLILRRGSLQKVGGGWTEARFWVGGTLAGPYLGREKHRWALGKSGNREGDSKKTE